MNYAYIRVSTTEQKIDRQMLEIAKYNIPVENIYIDYQSGKNFERAQYKILREKLVAEDVLYIKSIDRLGRDYRMIIDEWRYLTQTLRIGMIVIDMPLLNIQVTDALVNTFISDIVLQVLSFVAEKERENIRQRQREGIVAAKLQGKNLGHPFLVIPDGFEDEVNKYAKKEQTLQETLANLQMSRSSFYKYTKHLKKRKLSCIFGKHISVFLTEKVILYHLIQIVIQHRKCLFFYFFQQHIGTT